MVMNQHAHVAVRPGVSGWRPVIGLWVLLAPGALLAQDGGALVEPVALVAVSGPRGVCNAPCTESRQYRHAQLTLSAAASTDPAGGTPTVLWELLSRPQGANAELQGSAAAVQLFLTPDVVGPYDVGLMVTAADGAVARTQVRVWADEVPFVTRVVVRADGQEVSCNPTCTENAILIGSRVEADASGSSHDPFYGPLIFDWSLTKPPGSDARLKEETEDFSKVSLMPDVDGDYELQLKLRDQVSNGERILNFKIYTPAHWRPPFCSANHPAGGGAAVLGGLLLLCGLWRVRRR